MGEYNQPRAHFSPRKVKKLKSRGYDIPPPNMEPLHTPSGRRCARPHLGVGVRAPPGRRCARPYPGRRRGCLLGRKRACKRGCPLSTVCAQYAPVGTMVNRRTRLQRFSVHPLHY
jgi:hypothetical protein